MSTAEKTRTRGGDAGARIAAGIRAGIISGQHPPGTRIRQEDLAAEYGASRVPVREAIRQLEFEGLLTVVANAGAWVSTLTLVECEEVYQMRERLEPLLLSYSAPGLDAADLDRLADLAERIGRVGDDTEQFMILDREFHLFSYSRANTTQLEQLVHKLWNTTAPYRRAYVANWQSTSRSIAHEEHHLMVEALRDGDVEEAEHVLAGHIRRTRRQLSKDPSIFHSGSEMLRDDL